MKRKITFSKTKILSFIDQKKIDSIPRIFLRPLCVIFFFYSMQLFIKFTKNKNLEFQNNSKAILAYTLNNGPVTNGGKNEILNEKDLLLDIFSLHDLETDTVRLAAYTIKQLFEDTNYTLKDVREKN